MLPVDLDAELHFADDLLALTDRRLLSRETDGAWREWSLAEPGLELHLVDHAGVGTLDLQGPAGRLARWRYTLDRQPAALRLSRLLEQRQRVEGITPVTPFAPAVPVAPAAQAAAVAHPVAADEPAERTLPGQVDVRRPPSTWVLLRLARFARPYRKQLITGFVLTLLSTAATLVPPYLTIPLMDDILIPFQNGQQIAPGKVVLFLSALLAAALAGWGLGWARTYLLALVSERIGADLRTTTYEHLLTLPLDYFGGKRTGDLMARIGSETDRINVFLSLHALDFATDVLMILMTATILVSIDPLLAAVTLVPLPFIGWMIYAVRDRLRTGFEKIDRVWSEVTNVLADTIPGIRVVKAFAQERREADRFGSANAHNLKVNDRLNRTWSLFTPSVSLLTEIGLLVVWGFGIWQVARGRVTVGVLTAFIAYIGRFYTRLDSMSRIVSVTQKAASGAKRIFDILDHVSNVPEPAQPVPVGAPVNPGEVPRLRGHIEMSGLGFRYGSRAVIRELNLTIEPGEMIGLVGHSGSGKSTLVNLICRFYDVTDGAIKVDGT
ncbi:MAG TPA: ABC transporter transmembrane domain-containing protein, partial [Candidatus Limnocylindrales bacterium]|nr:ABC transporter transmembrane domain-containing protein [Candidatus Limnocylindrales bacterium]